VVERKSCYPPHPGSNPACGRLSLHGLGDYNKTLNKPSIFSSWNPKRHLNLLKDLDT